MKLILVRHGESEANVGLTQITGTNGLTEKGKEQARQAAKKIMDEKIDAVFCSPSERCKETMDEILKIIDGNVPIHFSKLLGPKMKTEEIAYLKDRIKRFIEDLKCEFGNDETILIITHQMPIRMFSYILNGKDLITENGSVDTMEVTGECSRQ